MHACGRDVGAGKHRQTLKREGAGVAITNATASSASHGGQKRGEAQNFIYLCETYYFRLLATVCG
jgi:hypothetical protein